MSSIVNVTFALYIALVLGAVSSIVTSEYNEMNLEDPRLEVFFDLNDVKSSVGIVTFPRSMKFVEIAQKIIESCSLKSSPQQVLFTHRNIPDSKNIGETVTPTMLGLEGYSSISNQPGGSIKVTLGYKVSLTVDKNQITSIALDLYEQVGEWIKRTLNITKDDGVLSVNSKIISSRNNLKRAFAGLINALTKEIKGDIMIYISQESRIFDTDGRSTSISINQAESLESILTRIDVSFPSADLLTKKMLCLNPTCNKNMTDMKSQFLNYQMKDYKSLYIPGLISINLRIEASLQTSRMLLERTVTVDKFIMLIRESFFNKDLSVRVRINSLDLTEEVMIDSLSVEENKSIYVADIGAYSFKIISDIKLGCIIEIQSTLANIVPERFKGNYSCSMTISEIQLDIHKYFSKPYSLRLYDSDDAMLISAPGEIVPEYVPYDKRGSQQYSLPARLYSLPLEAFRKSVGAILMFKYIYRVVLRVEYSKGAVLTPNDVFTTYFPIDVPTSRIYSELIKFSSNPMVMYPIPLECSPTCAIPLSQYYASIEDLNLPASSYQSQFMSLYTPSYPALLYSSYSPSAGSYAQLKFSGDFVAYASSGCYFTPLLSEQYFSMVLRRCLVRIGGRKWLVDEETLKIKVCYKGLPIQWKAGENWGNTLQRIKFSPGDVLDIEVRKSEGNLSAARTKERTNELREKGVKVEFRLYEI